MSPVVQRIKNRAQFEAAMAGGTISRTAHFVLHRAPLAAPIAPTAAPEASPPQALFAVQAPYLGVVIPKRWAKRAVTRNGIKRQVYSLGAALQPGLPEAAHVVRLRSGFPRDRFISAWSEPLKAAVRAELVELFARMPRGAGERGGRRPRPADEPGQAAAPDRAPASAAAAAPSLPADR